MENVASNEHQLTIAPIQAEDNAQIAAIIKHILAEHDLAIPGTAYFDPQLEDLYQVYSQGANTRYWILKWAGEVIGGVGVAPFNNSKEVAELQKLYIKPQFQGKGYASKLLNKALAFAAANEYEQLYLETSAVLNKANQIYSHFGFTELSQPISGSLHPAMDRWYIMDLK